MRYREWLPAALVRNALRSAQPPFHSWRVVSAQLEAITERRIATWRERGELALSKIGFMSAKRMLSASKERGYLIRISIMLIAVAVAALPFSTAAQMAAPTDRLEPLDALHAIAAAINPEVQCREETRSVVVTGHGVTIECAAAGLSGEFSFGTEIFIWQRFNSRSPCCRGTRMVSFLRSMQSNDFIIVDEAASGRFQAAWSVLGRPRAPMDPASDSEFLAGLQARPATSQQTENLRRVQVQAEAAIRGNRNLDAALLYRNALRTAPAWSDGHFNLGLLLGELELYPEAITEMRRYLYLAPDAEDARAVQDRIYEWEAQP